MNRFGLKNVNLRNDFEDEKKYIVKKGDSLYKIGKEYGVDINSLISANNLTSNLIYPNQVLVIPKKVNGESIYFEEYVVKPNDTLELISQKNNIDLDELAKYNDLTKLILIEDQILNIPRNLKKYVISSGDNLDIILDKTNMTLDELIELNIDEWLKSGNTIIVK